MGAYISPETQEILMAINRHMTMRDPETGINRKADGGMIDLTKNHDAYVKHANAYGETPSLAAEQNLVSKCFLMLTEDQQNLAIADLNDGQKAALDAVLKSDIHAINASGIEAGSGNEFVLENTAQTLNAMMHYASEEQTEQIVDALNKHREAVAAENGNIDHIASTETSMVRDLFRTVMNEPQAKLILSELGTSDQQGLNDILVGSLKEPPADNIAAPEITQKNPQFSHHGTPKILDAVRDAVANDPVAQEFVEGAVRRYAAQQAEIITPEDPVIAEALAETYAAEQLAEEAEMVQEVFAYLDEEQANTVMAILAQDQETNIAVAAMLNNDVEALTQSATAAEPAPTIVDNSPQVAQIKFSNEDFSLF